MEQVQSQLQEYKKNTVEFKLRRKRRTETDPAKTILSRKSKLMKGIQSRVEQGQPPVLPELTTVCHDYSDGQISANAGNKSTLHQGHQYLGKQLPVKSISGRNEKRRQRAALQTEASPPREAAALGS